MYRSQCSRLGYCCGFDHPRCLDACDTTFSACATADEVAKEGRSWFDVHCRYFVGFLDLYYYMLDQLTGNSVTIVSILRLRYLVAFGRSANPLCKAFYGASLCYYLIVLQGTVSIPFIGPTSRSTLRFGVSVCPTFAWLYENSSPN